MSCDTSLRKESWLQSCQPTLISTGRSQPFLQIRKGLTQNIEAVEMLDVTFEISHHCAKTTAPTGEGF